MLTLKYITENTEDVILRLAKKHFDGKEVIEKVNKLEMSWKKAYEVCKNTTLYKQYSTHNVLCKFTCSHFVNI